MKKIDRDVLTQNRYGGSEKKETAVLNNAYYLVKFPDPVRSRKNDLDYVNNQFSEDIGSKIFNEIGMPAQETFLAIINDSKGHEKTVCFCKDFTDGNNILYEFSKLSNAITGINTKFSTSIENITEVIDNTPYIENKNKAKESFWDMFVIDTLLANPDRHLDNFGFLENKLTHKLEFAPVYDCGSSLGALLSDKTIKAILEDKDKTVFKNHEYNVSSVFTIYGQRIFYNKIYDNMPKALAEALLRIYPKINLENIKKIIDNTEGISEERKKYIYTGIEFRKEKILDKAFLKVKKFCLDRVGCEKTVNQAGIYKSINEKVHQKNER